MKRFIIRIWFMQLRTLKSPKICLSTNFNLKTQESQCVVPV